MNLKQILPQNTEMANDVLYLQLLGQFREHNTHLSEFVAKAGRNMDHQPDLRRECNRLIMT